MRANQETCRCRAYAFPHREASGKCFAKEHGPYCGHCGEAAEPVQRDFGIGAYEAWGATGFDRNVQTVSRCCEATLYSDASLTIEYQP